jgi:hypothetical protein
VPIASAGQPAGCRHRDPPKLAAETRRRIGTGGDPKFGPKSGPGGAPRVPAPYNHDLIKWTKNAQDEI